MHVLDCASLESDRDPLADFEAIEAELAAYAVEPTFAQAGEGVVPLNERPRIVALNKTDLPDGQAMAEVLRMMGEVWAKAGPAATDVFLIQRLERIMQQVALAARQVQVREAAIIDSGSGTALPNYVASFPKIVGSIFNELRDTVGVDIGGALTGAHGGANGARPGQLSHERPAELDRAREFEPRETTKSLQAALAKSVNLEKQNE